MTQTRVHPETGKQLTRQTRKEIVSFGPLKREVEVQGWYPDDDSDSLHTGADLRQANAAYKALRAAYPDHVKQIRKKLKLTQEKAGLLIGGGKRAFQKYEAGTLFPSDAAMGLLEILNQQPDMIGILETMRSQATLKTEGWAHDAQMSPKRAKPTAPAQRVGRRGVAA
ncbi:type II toxin-antitoxin system MqsA family antitoxin [Rhodobacterales bacterium LSUCC0031]|nr:type II toxin-antitoxin system MqsA family antitoxin [Rhodobacterales bacterium LSUCC0031]